MPGIENNSPADQPVSSAQDATSGNSSALESGVNWSSLADEGDGFAEFDAVPQLEQPKTQESLAPVVPATPAVQQAPAPVPQVQTQQNPVIPPVGEAPKQQAPASVPPAPADDVVQLRQQYQETLQSKDYQLSQEEAVAFITEPETVIPRFAAQLHMRVMQDVGSAIRAALSTVPNMMEQMVTSQQQDQSARKEFYGEWPGLESHHDAVLEVMQLVRQTTPNATKQQVVQMTGMLVASRLGVDPSTLRNGGAAPKQQQVVQRQSGSVPPQPAGLGSSRGPGAGQQPSVWEQLATLDDDI